MMLNFTEYMNSNFVTKIINNIEEDEFKSSNDEKITECMINLLLSYNLQFSNPESNITLAGLTQRDNAKVLTENLLSLLNTESKLSNFFDSGIDTNNVSNNVWIEDPVQVLKLENKPKNSVEKLLNDILADPKTSKLIYINDVEVLIDIILRQLLNIPADEMVKMYKNV